jgi:hypothetical protein
LANNSSESSADKTQKKGQAYYIAPLQPDTLASVKTWGIFKELVV